MLPAAAVETKLGKNRTEAEVKRFTEEKERLEKEKDEIRAQLTQLRKERRELKEMLGGSTGRAGQGAMCGNEPRWDQGAGGDQNGQGGDLALWQNHVALIALEQELAVSQSLSGQNIRTCPS